MRTAIRPLRSRLGLLRKGIWAALLSVALCLPQLARAIPPGYNPPIEASEPTAYLADWAPLPPPYVVERGQMFYIVVTNIYDWDTIDDPTPVKDTIASADWRYRLLPDGPWYSFVPNGSLDLIGVKVYESVLTAWGVSDGDYEIRVTINDTGIPQNDDPITRSIVVKVRGVDYVVVLPDPASVRVNEHIGLAAQAYSCGPNGQRYYDDHGDPIPEQPPDDYALDRTFRWWVDHERGTVAPILGNPTTFFAGAGTGWCHVFAIETQTGIYDDAAVRIYEGEDPHEDPPEDCEVKIVETDGSDPPGYIFMGYDYRFLCLRAPMYLGDYEWAVNEHCIELVAGGDERIVTIRGKEPCPLSWIAVTFTPSNDVDPASDQYDFETLGINLIFQDLTEEDEETEGGWLRTNDDYDERNKNAQGHLVPDNEENEMEPGPLGHRIVDGDGKLEDLTVEVTNSVLFAGNLHWRLIFPDKVKIWNQTPTGYVEIVSGQQYTVDDTWAETDWWGPTARRRTHQFKLEGMSPTASRNEISITGTFTATGATGSHSDTVKLSCTQMKLMGGYRFGSLHKATAIPLPGDYQDSLNATHLFIPADCLIDGDENRAFGLVKIDGADLSDMVLKDEYDNEGDQIRPDMYEGWYWDTYRAFVNVWRQLLGLPPMTAQSMYAALVQRYGIPPGEAAEGKWWETPAYSQAGLQPRLDLYTVDPARHVAGPVTPLIRMPITLQAATDEVGRYEMLEVLITLDDEYFHHLGTDDKGMIQQDRFDAYDADDDGEKIIVDSRFRLVDYESGELVDGHEYNVPCFCMKETAEGSFSWRVRFSPPYVTEDGECWELTVRAAVWHTAKGDTDGNYDEFNQVAVPGGTGNTYYHYYGYNNDSDDPPFGQNGNQHTDQSYFAQTDPLTNEPYDKDLPLPTLRFTCTESSNAGPLRLAHGSEDQRFFHRDKEDGSAPVYLTGLCRFVNLKETDNHYQEWAWSGWVDTPAEILTPLQGQSDEHFADILNIWLFSADSSLVHAQPIGQSTYKEEWGGFESATRELLPLGDEQVPEGRRYVYFDQGRADMLDRLFEEADERHVRLMVTIWGHPDLREPYSINSWGNERWGVAGVLLYNRTNSWHELSPSVAEFIGAADGRKWDYQRNYYRYLIARYAAYPSMGLWEAVSEYPGIQGAGIPPDDDTLRIQFANRVRDYFRDTDPFLHTISTSSQGFGSPTYTGGDYCSTHAYGPIRRSDADPFVQSNSYGVLTDFLNNAYFRSQILTGTAQQLILEAPADQPCFHGEVGCMERHPDNGDDLLIATTGVRKFKGITAYHYVLMYDLLNRASGTPLKWNDAKQFGEMKARSAVPGSEQYCPYFSAGNYGPDFFQELSGHKKAVKNMIEQGIAPWSIEEMGTLAQENGTRGYWARNDSVAVCWLFKATDVNPDDPPEGGPTRSLQAAAPPGGQSYELRWVNPWSGDQIIQNPEPEVLPGADPGAGAPWIGKADVWNGKMDHVTPAGFDGRQKEDILVIIRKQ